MELIPLIPGLGYLMPAEIKKPILGAGYNRCSHGPRMVTVRCRFKSV